MPPPEPRSRTVSPAWRSARAVGLPQPSDASTAPSGSAVVWEMSYRFSVTGSQPHEPLGPQLPFSPAADRKSTRLNSSHSQISYAVFCLKKKKKEEQRSSQYLL